jgi:hypothetical protein
MMSDTIIVYSPEKELEVLSSLAEVGDKVYWKPAIILSAAYLEKFGIEKLKQYFWKKKTEFGKKLENLSLSQAATLLYGLNLIKNGDFTQINQVWSERIRIVHPKGSLPAYVGKEANRKYGKIITNALKIIESLKKKECVES